MKLFYEKYISFCTNARIDKEKFSCGKHTSPWTKKYMKKRVKEVAIKKVGVNSLGYLIRYKLGPVGLSYSGGYWYKISSKENVNFLIYDPLIKKKTFKKNFIETKCKKQYLH